MSAFVSELKVVPDKVVSCLLGSSMCIWMQSRKSRILRYGREWRLLASYADDLCVCGESEQDLQVTMEYS